MYRYYYGIDYSYDSMILVALIYKILCLIEQNNKSLCLENDFKQNSFENCITNVIFEIMLKSLNVK